LVPKRVKVGAETDALINMGVCVFIWGAELDETAVPKKVPKLADTNTALALAKNDYSSFSGIWSTVEATLLSGIFIIGV
jgi:hypothetical protein